MLAARPGQIRFDGRKDSAADRRLLKLLKQQAKATERIKILDPDDVLLDHKGRVQGRFSLTTLSLMNLCSNTIPYLSHVIHNVAGISKRRYTDSEIPPYDEQMAIRWLNDAIKLRFADLYGQSLVVDHVKHRVEGIVGRRYAFMSNLSLYEEAKAYVGDAQFREAVVSGRRMMLRFCERRPAFTIPAPGGRREPFYGGYHFANSEVGECSVKASSVLFRQWCDNKAISPFHEGGNLVHRRLPTFEVRFQTMLERTRARVVRTSELREPLLKLKEIKLGFGGERKRHEARFAQLQRRLMTKGVDEKMAVRILRRALVYGSYRADAGEDSGDGSRQPLMQLCVERTAFDLFNATTHECKKWPPKERELAEQLAYQMIVNKFAWS